MRLTCPECGAQYEVDAALIPLEGRAVECARCGHGWRQPGRPPEPIRLGDPDLAPRIAGDEEPSSPMPPSSMPSSPMPGAVPFPRASAAVLEILREEAQRELAQRELAQRAARAKGAGRAAEPPPPGPGSRPPADDGADDGAYDRFSADDLPFDAAGDARPAGEGIGHEAVPAPDRPPADQPELIVAELVEDHELPGAVPAGGDGPFGDPQAGRRFDGQAPRPDPEAVPGGAHWSPPTRPVPHLHPASSAPGAEGYAAGFGLAVGLSLLLAAAYLAAPPLAGQGRIGAGLSEYRLAADRGRLWLHDHTVGLFSRD